MRSMLVLQRAGKAKKTIKSGDDETEQGQKSRRLLRYSIRAGGRRLRLRRLAAPQLSASGAKDLPHPSTILLGSDATETHFKHLDLAGTEVVHLALHGYVDLEYPDRSSLVFAPDSPGGDDDGLLQVREIRRLHLNARLVTLSACNTGVGPVGESGVTNLVNAFIEAGADSVVSTLWEVDDHAAPYVMETFYTQLAAHKRKVDALRMAQLEMLNLGLAPYFWASFQIVGHPDGTL